MKFLLSSFLLLIFLSLIFQNNSCAQTGTWTELTNPPPHPNAGVMLLLTDGTVICENETDSGWDKLTPDIHGSYANGTWSSITSMHNTRTAFSSQVMPNGKVYVAGGEHGDGGNLGEVYDPVTDTWTPCGKPQLPAIGDCNSTLLPDGTILQGLLSNSNLIYNPASNTYSFQGNALYGEEESSWLKLPDNSIVFVGTLSTYSTRYIPSLNAWVADDTVPVSLYDVKDEEGPAVMLPNGKGVFFGAGRHNAIYTPSGSSAPGKWTAAADFPIINNQATGQPDAPAAALVNGKVLCAVSAIDTVGAGFEIPTYFVEYDYTTNTFQMVTAPIPGQDADSALTAAYAIELLDLPDGNVLMADYGYNNYWIYTPAGSPIAAGKPTIDSIITAACPGYKITGKLFNGISEGADVGDDWQMSTNYPIVRLSNGTNVYYAKTTNWNRIGAVQTGNLEDTTTFTLPPSLPAGTYSLVVVANGIASDPISFTKLAIILSKDTVINAGSSVQLLATGTSSVTWSPAEGLSCTQCNDPVATPTTTTTYKATIIENSCSISDSVTITIKTAAGINSVNGNADCSIYPNPNNGDFFVNLTHTDGETTIQIYNLLGSKIYQANLNSGKTEINLTGFPAGIYFSRIINAGSNLIAEQKIIVQ